MIVSKLLNHPQPKYLPLIAIALSIAVLLVFWSIVPGGSFQPANDDHANFYLPVGQNIAGGNGITLHGKPALDYPPGFPVIVAANLLFAKTTGCSDLFAMRLSFVLFFAAGALLIFALAGKIWGPYHAFLASALWSCYPVVLWSTKNPSTELPFSVFLYAAILCSLNAWSAKKHTAALFVLAGIVCGISMLIRPISMGLGIMVAVMVLLGRTHRFRKRLFLSLCLIAGNVATIAPWEIWAYTKTHEIIPLSGSARASITLFDGLAFAVWNPEGIRKGITVPQDVKKLMTEVVDRYLEKIETTRPEELRNFMIDKFKSQPVTVMKLFAIKIVRSWYGTFTNRLETHKLRLTQWA